MMLAEQGHYPLTRILRKESFHCECEASGELIKIRLATKKEACQTSPNRMANSKEIGRGGTSTFALANRPRATRAMVAKVRTGCITFLFRRRHVKCDESKPSCQRCLKWRGHCDGYEDGCSSKSQTPEASKRKTRPSTPEKDKQKINDKTKDSNKVSLPKWYPTLANESSKLVDRPQEVCSNSPEHKRLEVFKADGEKRFRPETCGFGDGFWKLTVPHLLRSNPSVWYANLAIHALVDAKRPPGPEEGGSQTSTPYSRALRYHGLALGKLREEAISRGSLQSATLCCLFFVIFEMMHDDNKAAQAHMYNGCKMLEEWHRNTSGMSLNSLEVESMLHLELRKALRFIATQVNGPGAELLQGSPGGGATPNATPGEVMESMNSFDWFDDWMGC